MPESAELAVIVKSKLAIHRPSVIVSPLLKPNGESQSFTAKLFLFVTQIELTNSFCKL